MSADAREALAKVLHSLDSVTGWEQCDRDGHAYWLRRADAVLASGVVVDAARLDLMTREVRLSREATEKAVASRVSVSEIARALRAADAPEDSMATEEDSLRYVGRAEAVEIMRDMLGLTRA